MKTGRQRPSRVSTPLQRVWRAAALSVVLALLPPLFPPGAAASPKPQVVCLTRWGDNPLGVYRTRPHNCDYHLRGAFPAAHANIEVTRSVHWSHWGGLAAFGRGKVGISTYGLAPVQVQLSQRRQVCGHSVFTHARFKIRIRVNGKTQKFTDNMALDDCLS